MIGGIARGRGDNLNSNQMNRPTPYRIELYDDAVKTTQPDEELDYNQFNIMVHEEAKQWHPALLNYIVTPRVNHSHLERVLMARK